MFHLLIIVFLIGLPQIYAGCTLNDTEKNRIKEEEFPNVYVSISVLVILHLLIFIIFIILGYISAGYHFYEQIVHDEIDEKLLKEREERIQKIMEEQDLIWQMKKAKEERQKKNDAKIDAAVIAVSGMLKPKKPKMITFEEHEKKIHERKISEQKLEERVKESEKRVIELEEKLRKYQTKERRKIQQIQVKKSDYKLKDGQKLLSGAVKPITPGKGSHVQNAETKPTKTTKSLPISNSNVNFNHKPPISIQKSKGTEVEKQISIMMTPKMSSTEEKQSDAGNEKAAANSTVEPKQEKSKKKEEKKSRNKIFTRFYFFWKAIIIIFVCVFLNDVR